MDTAALIKRYIATADREGVRADPADARLGDYGIHVWGLTRRVAADLRWLPGVDQVVPEVEVVNTTKATMERRKITQSHRDSACQVDRILTAKVVAQHEIDGFRPDGVVKEDLCPANLR